MSEVGVGGRLPVWASGRAPGTPSIAALAKRRAPPATHRTAPVQDFHYIRHDRCYLHPVMFFDSLLRPRGRAPLFTCTYVKIGPLLESACVRADKKVDIEPAVRATCSGYPDCPCCGTAPQFLIPTGQFISARYGIKLKICFNIELHFIIRMFSRSVPKCIIAAF